MISLVLDTAGTDCAVCLFDSANDRILARTSQSLGRGHAERLMANISEVLNEAKISYHDIDKIITSIGPGSFTGIRVGVATARGFGLGLAIPVVGVSNLEAVMEQARQSEEADPGAPLGAVMKAGRGQAYCQFSFETPFAARDMPFLAAIDELVKALDSERQQFILCGDAAEETGNLLANKPVIVEKSGTPLIDVIAHIGSARSESENRPEPLYIRKPDAKPQAGFAVDRSG